MRKMTTRRTFIKRTVLGTAAMSLGGILEGFSAKSYNNIIGANERIRVGAIGVNSRGLALACNFAKQENCEVIGLCDVDARALQKCYNAVQKIKKAEIGTYKDLRNLLENKKIDAVMTIFNAGDLNKSLLFGLGLKKLFTFSEGEISLDPQGGTSQDGADRIASARTVLEAHKTLMDVDEENVRKFEKVVDFVQKDLDRLNDKK